MIKGTDYVNAGWFSESCHSSVGEHFYHVTVLDTSGETEYDAAKVISRDTLAGEINKLSWLPVNETTGCRVYRGSQNTDRADLELLKEVASGVTTYVDDGVDEIIGGNSLASNTSDLTMSPAQIALGNLSLVNFGRTGLGNDPVDGSNCSVDYDYYLGRKDIIYATIGEEGAPANFPKLPVVSEDTLGLCSVDCPLNSVETSIISFGLTRIIMDQIHEIIDDVEDLKYSDAQFQMNNEL